jgi:lipoate-protein ligase A
VRLEGGPAARRVREVLLTGDFFITPPRIVYDLEARLRGVGVPDIGATVDAFMRAASPDLLSLPPEEFRHVIEAAVAQDTGR